MITGATHITHLHSTILLRLTTSRLRSIIHREPHITLLSRILERTTVTTDHWSFIILVEACIRFVVELSTDDGKNLFVSLGGLDWQALAVCFTLDSTGFSRGDPAVEEG